MADADRQHDTVSLPVDGFLDLSAGVPDPYGGFRDPNDGFHDPTGGVRPPPRRPGEHLL